MHSRQEATKKTAGNFTSGGRKFRRKKHKTLACAPQKSRVQVGANRHGPSVVLVRKIPAKEKEKQVRACKENTGKGKGKSLLGKYLQRKKNKPELARK